MHYILTGNLQVILCMCCTQALSIRTSFFHYSMIPSIISIVKPSFGNNQCLTMLHLSAHSDTVWPQPWPVVPPETIQIKWEPFKEQTAQVKKPWVMWSLKSMHQDEVCNTAPEITSNFPLLFSHHLKYNCSDLHWEGNYPWKSTLWNHGIMFSYNVDVLFIFFPES